MARAWFRPYTYDTALAHITEKQKNRKSIKLHNAASVLERGVDDAYVAVTYYRTPIVVFYRDGAVELRNLGSTLGGNQRIMEYSTQMLNFVGVGKYLRYLDFQHLSPSRVVQCGYCHGYVRGTPEEEAILHELACHPLVGWYGHSCDSKQALLHRNGCHRCENFGVVTIGGKPTEIPLSPDGSPVSLFLKPEDGTPNLETVHVCLSVESHL